MSYRFGADVGEAKVDPNVTHGEKRGGQLSRSRGTSGERGKKREKESR